MSEQAGEAPNGEATELAPAGDAAFAQLMDILAPEPDGAPAGQEAAQAGTPAAPADGAGGGSDAPPVPGAADASGADGAADAAAGKGGAQPGAGGDAAPGGDGAAAGTAASDAAGSGGGAQRPAEWTATADSYVPKLGELSVKLEESTQEAYRNEALGEIQKEHEQYFAALKQHPRLLVGKQVPKIDGTEGMETLASTQDAKDWQDAVKSILVEEVQGRASKKFDENRDFLNTIHASIDLFKNNPDLIPGTKDFDVELANRFAVMAKPYELRVDGKLQGYSIPVQPLIEQLREQVVQARQAAPPPAASSPAAGGGQQKPAADPPQAGIASKAGGGGEQGEDFSTLFGTIGLPNIRI